MANQAWAPVCLATALSSAGVMAADLQPRTVAAFDRYVTLTESRLQKDPAFLWIDSLTDARRGPIREQLRRKEMAIEQLKTKDGARDIDVPDGLIHHWIGTAFVENATIEQALTILQNYDQHQQIYAPTVAGSKLLSRKDDRFHFFLRFSMKKVITVVVNSEHDARFFRPVPN